jgi:general nucleoside transport system permease protein
MMKLIEKINPKTRQKISQLIVRLKPILISIAVGLFIGFLIMFIFNPAQSFRGFYLLLIGGFKDGFPGFIIVLHKSAPIILTGLAVTFAFRTGLFNIGAAGQFMIGAMAAILTAHILNPVSFIGWLIPAMIGGLAGALWGFIPGLLKATRNVNEVVASIMLNYIAAYTVALVIQGTFYNETTTSSRPVPVGSRLPLIFNNTVLSSVDISFIIAVIVAIIAHIILSKTVLGFQLRASGFSLDASKYAGMNTKKNVILAMSISGLFAGLGGSLFYLTASREYSTGIQIAAEGFTGISVALLGLGEPIGVIFSAIFLTHLKEGGFNLQSLVYATELSDIINAVIVYFVSISVGLQLYFKHLKKKRLMKKEEGNT